MGQHRKPSSRSIYKVPGRITGCPQGNTFNNPRWRPSRSLLFTIHHHLPTFGFYNYGTLFELLFGVQWKNDSGQQIRTEVEFITVTSVGLGTENQTRDFQDMKQEW